MPTFTASEPVPFDLPLAREAFATAGALQAAATRRAAEHVTPDDIAVLEALNAEYETALADGRVGDAIAHDTAFHHRFFELADDPDLLVSAELIMPRLSRMDLWLFTRKAFDPSQNSHPGILAALCAGDGERAAELVEASFTDAGEMLAAIVERSSHAR
ncbi:FCD domain-containing protein [Baekduia sp. Peel2402]|uniref:FCD domain-containing protein n=1 Tax=Baekduia sp. Peel2402 TaxID=3458296 RepID=UPI00403E6672